MLRRVWPVGLLSCCLVVAGSCSSSDDGSGGTVVVGFVFDDSGSPVPGAEVQARGRSATTDSDGRFTLPVSAGTMSVLTFEAQGYAPAYRRVDAPAGATVAVSAVLFDAASMTVDVRTSSDTLSFGDGALTFPQGSLVLDDGSEPDGPVTALVTWIDPMVLEVLPSPVPMIGRDGTQTGPLVSYGMVEVTLRYDGQAAKLASGEVATLTVQGDGGEGEEVGLFFADPEEGLWVKEGEVTYDQGVWTAEIPHFSWINFDAFRKTPPEDCACLRFVARTPAGDPLPGVFVDTRWQGVFAQGITDVRGELCDPCYPRGVPIQVSYGSFLDPDSPDWIVQSTTVTTNAVGASCGSDACEEVELVIACLTDDHCANGQVCNNGVCGAGTSSSANNAGCIYGEGMDEYYCIMQPNIPESVAKQSCDASDSTWVPSGCPAAGSIGACTLFQGETGEMVWVYYMASPTTEDLVDMADQCQSTPAEAGGPGSWEQPYTGP